MKKKLLAIFAHPDDEAFGPGGSLALYASRGVEIHLLCATKGEKGEISDKNTLPESAEVSQGNTSEVTRRGSFDGERIGEKSRIAVIREKELFTSAKILGIAKVEFLDFRDGFLSNAIYHKLADKIIKKIKDFRPQVVVTLERLGVSGHLDHIAVSMITTYAFLKTKQAKKLYYFCMPRKMRVKELDDYFIYFPEGYRNDEITTRIDIASVWKKKIESMKAHRSQLQDVKLVLSFIKKRPKIDHFILQCHRGVKPKFPEINLFAGM